MWTEMQRFIEKNGNCHVLPIAAAKCSYRDGIMTLFTLFKIKQLLLVPLAMLRKDFKFFWIFKGLSVYVINSTVYSPPRSRGSQCLFITVESWLPSVFIHHRGVKTKRWWIHQGVNLNWFSQPKPVGTKYIRESDLIHCSYSLVLFVTRKLFVHLFWCLLQIHQKVNSQWIHHRGVKTRTRK